MATTKKKTTKKTVAKGTKKKSSKKPELTPEEQAAAESERIAEIIEKRRGGRPSKYCADIIEQSFQYIDECQASIAKSKKNKMDLMVPSIKGLALYLMVSERVLYDWREDHVEFLHTLELIEQKQHELIATGGITGVFSPTVAKLMMHNHGYKDRVDNTTDDKPINNEFTDEQYKDIANRIANGKTTDAVESSE